MTQRGDRRPAQDAMDDRCELTSVEAAPPETHLRILQVIRLIPAGRVCTYSGVAAAAGLPGRARLVGRVLRDSPFAEGLPWHRVINASGRISLRPGGGVDEQTERLLAEGIEMSADGRIDLGLFLWHP